MVLDRDDFVSLDGVRKLSEGLNDHLDKLDLLINNAGRSTASSREYKVDHSMVAGQGLLSAKRVSILPVRW